MKCFARNTRVERKMSFHIGLLLLALCVFYFPGTRVRAETWCSSSSSTNCAIGGIVSVNYAVSNAPPQGLTSITFPFTVFSIPAANGYFFAQQFYFINTNNESGQGAYIGIQPAGNGTNNAHFSFFGTGSSSVNMANCSTGADGGNGTTCQLTVQFAVGHQYNLTVYRDAKKTSVWHGEIVDNTACQVTTARGERDASTVCTPTEIGAWNIGYTTALASNGVGFVEYFPSSVPTGCSGLPYADVEFGAPSTPDGLTSTVNGESSYGGCLGSVNYSGSQSTHNLWVRAETGW
ncbi:hypothetical protein [Rhodanobacter sp. DHG33]|uniref:hypothetical protein n=1 Tax=Rhodanobacter sp. DHG33 TaxID=2775921 RepID=UPI00177D32B0|nr:hypothetical protein [Rhodanobacter sp. DHG33]MBD8899972.1 hypothetical protein [Rhodanobacter sp. DHG33]